MTSPSVGPTTAPPTGPLFGATRVRPDGWLPTPLTTDPRQAESQARWLLVEHHPDHAHHPIRCLSARYRTSVFAVGDPPTHVLKRHAAAEGYHGEVLAYTLLAADNVLPGLVQVCDRTRTLIVTHLPIPVDLRQPGMFIALVDLVARAHTAPFRWPVDLRPVVDQWTVRAALASPAPGWVPDPLAWKRVLHQVADAHGLDHVPLGNLDLKADHMRAHATGDVALVDAETFRPDTTGIPDLVTLAWIARTENLGVTGAQVRGLYLDHVNAHGARWTDDALVTAVNEWAAATGLDSLHHLTQ